MVGQKQWKTFDMAIVPWKNSRREWKTRAQYIWTIAWKWRIVVDIWNYYFSILSAWNLAISSFRFNFRFEHPLAIVFISFFLFLTIKDCRSCVFKTYPLFYIFSADNFASPFLSFQVSSAVRNFPRLSLDRIYFRNYHYL